MKPRAGQVLTAVGALCVLAAIPFAVRWLRIDSCFDRGAAWDYGVEACVTTHPPAPP